MSFCQITSGKMLAEAKIIALLIVCLNGDNQITQTLAITQLTEHRRKGVGSIM